MTPRPGTVLRPTARGIVAIVLAVACWVLADLTRVMPARYLAAALLLALLIGAAGILISRIGLDARRQVLDDAVPVGSVARVQLDLVGRPPLTVLPLGRGAVREHLPAALGGQGDLTLARHMPHVLRVSHRGPHELGPISIIVRDVFGLFHLRRTIEDGQRITGLPVVAELTPAAARATGITREGTVGAAMAPGVGEIGPIARPYATGDDIRRIHWRASARTGQLMTREDEPAEGHSAVVVLDTTRRGEPDPEVEDRLVSHAATVLESLGQNGWEVRVLEASGDEITRTGTRRGLSGTSPLGSEADALEQRSSLMALAELDFDDDCTGIGQDHAAGHTALAIALGPDDGEPFAGLELDRFAGRAANRTAIALRALREDDEDSGRRRPARRIGPGAEADEMGHDGVGADGIRADGTAADGVGADGPLGDPAVGPAPTRSRLGAWTLVRGTTADSLTDLLTAAEAEETP
ncbi:DUF58 domain-containing protein [Brachybacterium sp. GCM10030252]|uniref:DUF58 domain-containing protein n=1 Tax=Brachybacterium sp. GCM10030252 TaxID=3273380 RepID=UPI00362302B5